MISRERFIESVKKNTNLWISLWVLLLLNILLVFVLIKSLSWILVLVVFLLLIGGISFLLRTAHYETPELAIDAEVQARLHDLMEEIRPYCEEVFDNRVKRSLKPLEQNFQQKFTMGLTWLWETVDVFYTKVEESAQGGRAVFQLIDYTHEEKLKLIQRLQDNAEQVLAVMQNAQKQRRNDEAEIHTRLQAKISEFRNSMLREKQYFYEYVYKMLLEQARAQGKEIEMVEFLSPVRLGQQFGIIVERSVRDRVSDFNNSLLKDLEDFSADVVGRFQKSTAQVLNIFRDMKNHLQRLRELSSNESGVVLRRLDEYALQISELEEQAGEILVSLAWQDIMVEKRWGEIQEQLFSIKDQVIENTDEEAWQYIEEVLQQDIPGLSVLPRDTGHALIYKALVDAELIYQVYTNNRLPEVVNDGVYSLLQFVRSLELCAAHSINLTDEQLDRLRTRKALVKERSLRVLFGQVRTSVEHHHPLAVSLLEGIFPRKFQQFVNSPYLKNTPVNLNQAAWMLFNSGIDNEYLPEDKCLLIGLLLALHQIRDRYIQPFNSSPVKMENPDELHKARTIAYQAFSIMLQNQFAGK